MSEYFNIYYIQTQIRFIIPVDAWAWNRMVTDPFPFHML